MDSPRRSHFVLICLVAMATLCFELLATRILAFVFWSHVVYLVISIALLGYGASSTLLALNANRVARVSEQTFLGVNLALFGGSALLAIALLVKLKVQLLQVITAVGFAQTLQLASPLLMAYGLCLLPFFFSGNVVIYLFTRYPRSANRLYLFDLCGAAAGCLAFVLLIDSVGAVRGVALCTAVAIGAALIWSLRSGDSRMRPALIVACVVLAVLDGNLLVQGDKALALQVDDSKTLAVALSPERNPGARIEYTDWDVVTRFDVVSNPSGLDFGWDKLGPDWKLITFDGDAVSHMRKRTSAFPTAEDYAGMKDNFMSRFFGAADGGKALVIGLGGGPDLASALLLKAKSITGVDINGALIDAMKGPYAEFTGNLYNRPEMNINHSDGRSYLARHGGRYDLIMMSGVDTFTALSTGAYVMAENHLYTEEAVEDYVSSLSDKGSMYVLRWYFPRFPREELRLFMTYISAMKKMGIKEPWRHMIVLWNTTSFKPSLTIIRKQPYSEQEARTLLASLPEVNKGKILPLYFPLPPQEWIERGESGARFFYAGAEAARQDQEHAFYEQYPFDVEPTTDDKPFFFKYYKFSTMLRDVTGAMQHGDAIHGYYSFIVFMVVLAAAAIAVCAFVWLPLIWFRRDGLGTEGSVHGLIYFATLGLGFIMLEIALMQRFSVFLQHPMYSIAAVMGSMLFFAGVGSLVSERWSMKPLQAIQFAGLAVISLVGLDLVLGPLLRELLLGTPLAVRLLFAILWVAPLAVTLGFFFPLGLSLVQQRAVRFVPWAWAINSGFTVIGSVLAIVFAMVVGFGQVMLIAAGLYGLGLLAIARYTKASTPGETPHASASVADAPLSAE